PQLRRNLPHYEHTHQHHPNLAPPRQSPPSGRTIMNHQRDQFDQHPRTAAPAAAVRPNLATTTLRLSLQARRARHLRRWLAVIIIFVVALGLAKWLKQDALYLAQ